MGPRSLPLTQSGNRHDMDFERALSMSDSIRCRTRRRPRTCSIRFLRVVSRCPSKRRWLLATVAVDRSLCATNITGSSRIVANLHMPFPSRTAAAVNTRSGAPSPALGEPRASALMYSGHHLTVKIGSLLRCSFLVMCSADISCSRFVSKLLSPISTLFCGA